MIKNATLSLLILAGMMSGSSARCICNSNAILPPSTTREQCEGWEHLGCIWVGRQGEALLTLEADADSPKSNHDHANDAPATYNTNQQHELPIDSANTHSDSGSGSGSTRISSQHDVNNSGGRATSSFSDGLIRGQSTAQRIWLRMGNDCTNALRSTFDDRIQSEIHSRGWYRSGSGRNVEETSFNKGARVGMQQMVDEYAKKCINGSADVCVDLGNLSAFDLALRHCGSTRTSSRGAFHSVCRDIGISQCQGSVFSRVADLCGPPSTSELLSLQNECESAVMRRS